MAEWLMRSTVNTFFRGSIPLDAFNINYYIITTIVVINKLNLYKNI